MTEIAMDFRSDTLTLPTAEMRSAMAEAAVGDDVFGEDPTVNRLQERVAEMLGKEAALFVSSGTMSNLIAVRTHCRPGDEMICDAECHMIHYEQGGYAQICGVALRPVPGVRGVMQLEQIDQLIRPSDSHFVRTRLVSLENTHNRGGGRIQPYETVEAICGWARANGLRTHLDGARLFNAVVATGIEAPQWAQHFDTVGVCFSKGLGAPVGSALAGSRELIEQAHRHRKVIGGGMRQAGIIAAAALYALENHVDRLAEDHANALRLAQGVSGIAGLDVCDNPDRDRPVDTNLLFVDLDPSHGTAAEFAARLRQRGLLVLATGPARIRAVTHLGITAADVDRAVNILGDVARNAG